MYNSRPIYVTGVPRCGSSWVGQVLGSLKGIRYVYEPFNPKWSPSLAGKFTHFEYLDSSANVQNPLLSTADSALRGKQSARQFFRSVYRGYFSSALSKGSNVVVKDPTAPLIVDWLHCTYNIQPLIILRHPCGFASSIGELGWELNVNQILRQERLMQTHLSSYRSILEHAKNDIWATRASIWSAIYTVLVTQSKSHSDWLFYEYEAICQDPISQFREVSQKLGLQWSKSAESMVEMKSGKNSMDPGSTNRVSQLMPEIWKERLATAEVDTILEVCEKFGLANYPTCFRN